MFNVSWNVHSGVNASILGKIPVRQANAVKAKHHIPTVNANARVGRQLFLHRSEMLQTHRQVNNDAAYGRFGDFALR